LVHVLVHTRVINRDAGKAKMRCETAQNAGRENMGVGQNPDFIYCVSCARFQSRKTRKRSSLAWGGIDSSVSFPSVRIVNRIWSR